MPVNTIAIPGGIGGGDHLGIADRAAGLDHRGGAGRDAASRPSAKGRTRPRRPRCPVSAARPGRPPWPPPRLSRRRCGRSPPGSAGRRRCPRWRRPWHSTMAFDFTCLQTRNANSRSASLRRGRRTLCHHLEVAAPYAPVVAGLRQEAAGEAAERQAGRRRSGIPPVSSRRRFFCRATAALAASSASGAMITSVKIAAIFSAAAASSVRFTATMPP